MTRRFVVTAIGVVVLFGILIAAYLWIAASGPLFDLSQVESVTWAWILWLVGSVGIALAAAYVFLRLGRR
jgi:hypothetical protein